MTFLHHGGEGHLSQLGYLWVDLADLVAVVILSRFGHPARSTDDGYPRAALNEKSKRGQVPGVEAIELSAPPGSSSLA